MNKTICLPAIIIIISLFTFGGSSFGIRETTVSHCDTLNVPEGVTGEDSLAYIENVVFQSPISSVDLLSLAEVHSVEKSLCNYNNPEQTIEDPQGADDFMATKIDSAAMRLANRVMRMSHLVNINGDANDKLQLSIAVNAAIDTFLMAAPSVPRDSVLTEIIRVVDKFSSQSQREINFQCYVSATVDYCRTIESYRQLLLSVPTNIKPLIQREYEAWHNLNGARFAFWNDVSYTQGWYSMRPMETELYYENLSANRRAELQVEREIIIEDKPYIQKGHTVSVEEWEYWVVEHSVPVDIESLDCEDIPSDSLVAERVDYMKSSMVKWLSARQAVAAALPKEKGMYYNNLTTDIQCRIIGTLENVVPLPLDLLY